MIDKNLCKFVAFNWQDFECHYGATFFVDVYMPFKICWRFMFSITLLYV